jgi:hypothetical protein
MMSNLKFKFLSVIFFTILFHISEIRAPYCPAMFDLKTLVAFRIESEPDRSVIYNFQRRSDGLSRILVTRTGNQLQYYPDRIETYFPSGTVGFKSINEKKVSNHKN